MSIAQYLAIRLKVTDSGQSQDRKTLHVKLGQDRACGLSPSILSHVQCDEMYRIRVNTD